MEINVVEKFWRPDLLSAPNIPKPLHTVNPRTICGRWWWDIQRQEAYAKHDYCCWACGVPKRNAEFYHWLEAHEDYDIDWETGKVELKEIVALCHSCHSFIHNGRLLNLYQNSEIGRDKITSILEHGFDICKRNHVQPFYGAYIAWYVLKGKTLEESVIKAKKKGWYPKIEASWEKWHLIIEGTKYFSPFKDLSEWENHWN